MHTFRKEYYLPVEILLWLISFRLVKSFIIKVNKEHFLINSYTILKINCQEKTKKTKKNFYPGFLSILGMGC